MNRFVTSLDTSPGVFICTWDLGRRCNFDCSYCGADSHDNFSQHASLDELKKSVDFIFEYGSLIMPLRTDKLFSLSLTGGEPTVNPVFPELSDYLKARKDNESRFRVTNNLTTNGSFSKKVFEAIRRGFDGLTISYHCDSVKEMRLKSRNNMYQTTDAGLDLKVNVMFHNKDELFKECIELCEDLERRGIKYVPRIINGFTYEEGQAQWFKDFWKNQNFSVAVKKPETKEGLAPEVIERDKKDKDPSKSKTKFVSGRNCCMKIPLQVTEKETGKEQTILYCGDTSFTGWYCSINWKFLHVDQQRDEILHHQTCKANWGKTRGPIGKVSDWEPVIKKLREDIHSGKMETIQCTLPQCFCGVCAPKAQDFGKFQEIMKKHVGGIEFVPAT